MKLLIIPLIFVLALTDGINAEPASRYKLSCEDYPCSEDDLAALNLVNHNYGKKFEKGLLKIPTIHTLGIRCIKKKVIVNIQLQ